MAKCGDFRPDHKLIQERTDSPTLQQPLGTRLTESLLATSPDQFRDATRHPFLQAAGQGKLSKDTLSRWLSQDRLYAQGYISFVSALISRVSLPDSFVDKSKSLRWRIVNLLSFCLQNIHTELEFFDHTAQKFGLQLDLPYSGDVFSPNPVTEQYISLFRSFHLNPQKSLFEGSLVLWATERCYLDAWKFAASFLEPGKTMDADGGALREAFIPNWSSSQFADFVQQIADVMDELADRENAMEQIKDFQTLWLHVLDIEKGFWPDIVL